MFGKGMFGEPEMPEAILGLLKTIAKEKEEKIKAEIEKRDKFKALSIEEKRIELNRLVQKYNEPKNYVPGDFVKFKEGLCSGIYPSENCPAIVTEIANGQYGGDSMDPDDTEFMSTHDTKIATMTEDGYVGFFWLDGGRLEKVEL